MSIPEAVRSRMLHTNNLFGSAVIKNRQIDELDNIYTSGARILPPGAELIEGRSRIKAFWRQAIEDLGLKDAKLTTIDVEAAGDSYIEIGQADLTLGDSRMLTVKYVVQWREEGSIWKWHTDIWNMNQ